MQAAETVPVAQEPLDPGGRRSLEWLMALVAVLSVPLLLHCIISLWLLGLLCVIMAALGAWVCGVTGTLGGHLHLERFHAIAPRPHNPQAEKQLEQEIDLTIQFIIRDFVSSWYSSVSQERTFEKEVEVAMKSLVQELKRRMAQADLHKLLLKVLTLCGCHLQSYKHAKAVAVNHSGEVEPSQLWEAYCQLSAPHPAVQKPGGDLAYARSIVDLLLGLVPRPHLDSPTGRHVVVELITCNAILPLINKLADPDWIYLLLVGIFSKNKTMLAGGTKPPEDPSVPTSLQLPAELQNSSEGSAPSPAPTRLNWSGLQDPSDISSMVDEGSDAIDGLSGIVRDSQEEKRAGSCLYRFLERDIRGPLFLCEDAELESSLSDLRKETLMLMGPSSFLSERIRDALCSLESSQTPESQDSDGSKGVDGGETEEGLGIDTDTNSVLLLSTLNSCPEIQVDMADKVDEQNEGSLPSAVLMSPEMPCPIGPPSLEKAPPHDIDSLDSGLPQILLPASPTTGPLGSATFSFEPLSSPDGPVVIQNLRITGTITAREHSGSGFHPYTLYTVKYETTLDGESSSGLQQLAYHTVNRRYREFLNLQTRLEERSEFRKFLKNVKGPKKLFPDLPFGNMDSDKIEARKSLLESFLKQLCAVPELTNSEEVQEFLALNTDARIAFVKKPRIDKMVVNAIVDTLKTAFPRSEPQSPTEELSEAETDGKPQTEGKKASKSKLRFSSLKALNLSEAHERILYSLREDGAESQIVSMSGMLSFLKKQTKLLEVQTADACGRDPEYILRKGPEHDLSSREPGTDTALADTALDLLHLLLMDQWQWLCTEQVFKSLHFVFGTLIQRWLEVQAADLTCTQHWLQNLRLLRESIWPGGTLPKGPRLVRTPEQKAATEKQALCSLMGIVPDLVLWLLDQNKWEQSWSLVLKSLKQPLINRHLIFCLWDIVLESLDLPVSRSAANTSDTFKKSVTL